MTNEQRRVLEEFADLRNWVSAIAPMGDAVDGWCGSVGGQRPWEMARKALEVEIVNEGHPTMPQAFADAICNERNRLEYELTLALPDDREAHSRHRFHSSMRPRGFEGRNGVACDECRIRAEMLWMEYQRILGNLNRNAKAPAQSIDPSGDSSS